MIELPAAGSVAAVSESQSHPRKGEDKCNARTGGHQWVAVDTLAILKHREKLVCRKEAGPTLLHNLSRHPGNKGMSEPRATGDAARTVSGSLGTRNHERKVRAGAGYDPANDPLLRTTPTLSSLADR